MTARVRYTLTVVIEGDDYPATATCDVIENAIKGLGEGADIAGQADAYMVTVTDSTETPPGATVTVDVVERYL